MNRKEAPVARPGPDGRRPLLLTFVGNNRQMLNEIRDSLSHLRKNDVEGQYPDHLPLPSTGSLLLPPSLKQDLSQSTPNLFDKPGAGGSSGGGQGSKMTRRDNPHDKALAEIRDSLRPYQNAAGSGNSGTSLHNNGGGGGGGSDNSSVASSTSSHATSSDPEPSPSKVQAIMQYGFDEDLAVRALKCTGNQSAEAALRLLSDIIRHKNTSSGSIYAPLGSRAAVGASSPSASETNSVRSDSPSLNGSHRQQHQPQQQQQRQHFMTNGLQSPPPLPPRAPVNSSNTGPSSHRGHTPPPASTEVSVAGQQSVAVLQTVQHYHQASTKTHVGLGGVPGASGAASGSGGMVVPQGHVQQMISQLIKPNQAHYYHSGLTVTTTTSAAAGPTAVPAAVINGNVATGKQLQYHQQQYQRGMSPTPQHNNHYHHHHHQQQQQQQQQQQHHKAVGGNSGGSTPAPSPLLSMFMGTSSPSTPNSSPSPAPSSLSGSSGVRYTQQQPQAPPPPYSQAQAQIQAARMGVITSGPASTASSSLGSDSMDPRRPSPLLDVTMLPDMHQYHQHHQQQQQQQQHQHMLQQKGKMVASAAVSAVCMPMSSNHMPVIMPSVRSKEVTKPMPQTATAPLAPATNPPGAQNGHASGGGGTAAAAGSSSQHNNFVSQYHVNNITQHHSQHHNYHHHQQQQHLKHIGVSSVTGGQQQQQQHTPRIMAPGGPQCRDTNGIIQIPETSSAQQHHLGLPQLLHNGGGGGGGGGFTPEQLAALAAASGGQPTMVTSRQLYSHQHMVAGKRTPVGGLRQLTIQDTTPRSDSPVSRATNHSPMSVLSTSSFPSTNSDIPDKPPPPYPGRGVNQAAHMNPPLLPPRIPLKEKPPPPPPPTDQDAQQLPAKLAPSSMSAQMAGTSPSCVPHMAQPQANSLQQQQQQQQQHSHATNSSPPPPTESSSPPSETDETDTDASSVSAGTNFSSNNKCSPSAAGGTPTTATIAPAAGGGDAGSRSAGGARHQETTRCLSPLPQRKSEARERDRLRCDTKVRVYSPQAFKFYMEQHVENVLKSHTQRVQRRMQLEKEMVKVKLSEDAARQMRKMLYQKESNYIRLKRAKMDPCMFDKIKTLGVGAFGEVALVRKKDVGHLYAMKTLTKSNVIKRNQVAHVKAERDILAEADNEWVVKLYYSFQDEHNLYFVMDYVPGGDLMGQLIRKEILDEHLAQFYIAELVLAIHSVHKMGFIHRDIKPDNILIDKDGHIKLTDFGLCTGFRWTHNSKYYQKDGSHARQDSMEVNCQLDDQCRCEGLKPLEQRRERELRRGQAHSLVGTPNYIAPEVLLRLGYTKVCDWWSVGVILYEMVIGQPPFYANTPLETQYKVIHWKDTLNMRHCANISPEAQDLIRQLLQGAETRLGRNGAQEIKQHPFFSGINFDGLRRQPAPEKPTIRYLTDTSNFDPVDPDKLRTNDSDQSSKRADSKLENGKHPEHAFFEFTFRRFFDDGGHPCSMPSSLSSSSSLPQQQQQHQQQQQQADQESSNNSPVYV